jgi:hypothetical protein
VNANAPNSWREMTDKKYLAFLYFHYIFFGDACFGDS